MAKSVYSLVLADEVVQAIDHMAASMGHNRSSLVNRILAEHVSLVTPEARNIKVLKSLDYWASQQGLHVFGQSSHSLTVRTALSYKYNPTISYAVEMGEGPEELARLRLTLRSQNPHLVQHLMLFYQLWEQLEAKYLPDVLPQNSHRVSDKKYQRILRRPAWEEEKTAQIMAQYIGVLDGSLKLFFQNIGDINQAIRATESFYLQMLKKYDGIESL